MYRREATVASVDLKISPDLWSGESCSGMHRVYHNTESPIGPSLRSVLTVNSSAQTVSGAPRSLDWRDPKEYQSSVYFKIDTLARTDDWVSPFRPNQDA